MHRKAQNPTIRTLYAMAYTVDADMYSLFSITEEKIWFLHLIQMKQMWLKMCIRDRPLGVPEFTCLFISIEKLFVILANVSFEALSVASLIDKLIRLRCV